MTDDTFGRITFSFGGKQFPTPDNLKDSATTLLNVLNQKAKAGKGSIKFCLNYIAKARKQAKAGGKELPDDCRILIEITDASLECNLNDYQTFVAVASNLKYISTSTTSDEVEDEEVPAFA